MVTYEMVEQALNDGLPGLKELFNKLSKEDCLKALGILVLMGVGLAIINTVKEIVMAKDNPNQPKS